MDIRDEVKVKAPHPFKGKEGYIVGFKPSGSIRVFLHSLNSVYPVGREFLEKIEKEEVL